jgi:serine/threonine protein kinase
MSSLTLPLAPDRYTGRKLGKYEVLCQLSSGGMSQIFLAFQRGHAGFRKLVVLKQILPDIKADEDIVQMFLDEAKITAAFSHPHIAQVYDLDTQDGELFLAMEFVPGATLIEVARACRDANEAIPIGLSLMAVRDTALALHYAHTFRDPVGRIRQVIHRDVAEKNIMVTHEGLTKLLDFGIAKAVGRITRTAAGKVKGTSGYMSPEQIRGEELDPRSDLFSLGVVLHECLTGMRLYYDKDPEAGMLAVFKAAPPPPSEGNPEIRPELDEVVLKSLAHARDDRFATALEFARAIERVSGRELWHPEESAEFMTRHFDRRRQQTAELLEDLNFGEKTNFGKVPQISAVLPEREKPPESRPVRIDPLIAAPVPKRGVSAGPPASDLRTAISNDMPSAPGGTERTDPGEVPISARSPSGRQVSFDDETVVRPGAGSRRRPPSSDGTREKVSRAGAGREDPQQDQKDEGRTRTGENPNVTRPVPRIPSGKRARPIPDDPAAALMDSISETGPVGDISDLSEPSVSREPASITGVGEAPDPEPNPTGIRTAVFVVVGTLVALAVLGGAVLALRAMGIF